MRAFSNAMEKTPALRCLRGRRAASRPKKSHAQGARPTAGAVISRLARLGLRAGRRKERGHPQEWRSWYFPARDGEIVTLEHVQKLMDPKTRLADALPDV